MSPSPVTVSAPTDPASYAWEATDEGVAERYGLPLEAVVRFDLNTSPEPPGWLPAMLAAGRFETALSEYPPGDYRRLVAAAAARYGVGPAEVLPGAGADEVLELCAKAFLREGSRAVVATPAYAMYRVVTEQRGGTVVAVPRLGPAEGRRLDFDAVVAAARDAAVVWLTNPNNPTGRTELPGTIATLLEAIADGAARDRRAPAAVVVDEAYAEFGIESALPLRTRHPNLVVVRTASKAYGLAGMRVGFAIAAPGTIARIAPLRPPGSISTISASVVTAALEDDAAMRANVARIVAERPRLAAGLAAAGLDPEPSVANFLLLDLGSPGRAEAAADAWMRRGMVPRSFPHGHPLAHCLRVTVRDPAADDRLVAAAAAFVPALPPLPLPASESPR